ncbi:MAG: aldose 1-epimerase family protein [Candidatus Dormibacteria bacterium]
MTEVGAGLRSYAVAGVDVIDGYPEQAICDSARGALLLPWPNRIADGSYEFDGRLHQTPLTEPSRHNAIHGLTRWRNWSIREHTSDAAELTLRLHPEEGYPFGLDLEVEYVLGAEGLTVRTKGTNIGPVRLPYGTGHHPYLMVGTDLIDQSLLRLPALLRLDADERLIPTGKLIPVDQTPYDFLELRPIGNLRLDTAFASLLSDADGRIRSILQSPGDRRQLTLWMEPPYAFLMVFTGDGLKDPSRRRRSVAIEPMTCAPNAFRTGDGLRILEPGKSLTTTWGISPAGF